MLKNKPSSTVGGRLIDEMREARFKEGFECPHCTSEILNTLIDLAKLMVANAIAVRLVVRRLRIPQIQICFELEKEMSGLLLLNVCLKCIPCGNQRKS